MLTASTRNPSAAASARAHGFAMRADARVLGNDGDVDLLRHEAARADAIDRGAQHLEGIASPCGRVLIGEHLADVAGTRGTEQRIGDRVRDRIAIGVAREMHIAGNPDPAQDQRARRARTDANRSRSRLAPSPGARPYDQPPNPPLSRQRLARPRQVGR